MIAGIAGGNPKTTTLNSVVFSRFAVQVDLQYEIDAVELGGLFKTGYIPYGTQAPAPAQYPQALYGTEVFEINAALQKIVCRTPAAPFRPQTANTRRLFHTAPKPL